VSDAGPQILLVEDDADIRQFVRAALEGEGYRVTEAVNCERGLIEAGQRRPDLVLLDLGLPDRDGASFIRTFREWSARPVVVLSARADEAQKVAALDAGADDYLTKPFGVAEMLARVRAALRRAVRTPDAEASVVRFGDVVVDLDRRTVERAGAPVHVTPVEFRLLAMLVRHPGRLLTHRRLLNEVWGPSHAEDVHYLRVHMGHLRRKLEAVPARPRHLVTETGVGYRFVAAR
jgi:two-component system KDP operon response regulator KdpE